MTSDRRPRVRVLLLVVGLIAANAVIVGGEAVGSSPAQAAAVTGLVAGGGVMVDGWGGLHRLGIPTPMPGAVTDQPRWPGTDTARGVALVDTGGRGFVLR